MKSRKFFVGVAVTILWLAGGALLLYIKRSDLLILKPNEWGDFFAGLFAPLAFLWLVLGYLQQGEELKLSTNALHLQAEELKHSVEAQRALVEVTREQLESERAANEARRLAREAEVQPRLLLGGSPAFFSERRASHRFQLSNAGGAISDVSARIYLPGGAEKPFISTPILASGAITEAQMTFDPVFVGRATVQITYRDATGRDGEVRFFLSREASDAVPVLRISGAEVD